MPAGRPLKWTDPKQIEALGCAFFEECAEKNLPITITGLALALDTNRQVLVDYQERDEFADTIKKLKSVCENYAEHSSM